MINGFFDPKFNKLRDVYEKNFHEELDIGSSLGISLNGEIVVNLWGGHKDKDLDSHWEEDTIINVRSSTKNMASLCAFYFLKKDYWTLMLQLLSIGLSFQKMVKKIFLLKIL